MKRLMTRLAAVAFVFLASGVAEAQFAMTVGNLANTIRFGDTFEQFEGLRDPMTVRVWRVSGLAGLRVSSERLDRAIAQREAVLHRLQRAVERSREAMRVLEIHGHTPDQVIWVDADADDRTALLYVDDR